MRDAGIRDLITYLNQKNILDDNIIIPARKLNTLSRKLRNYNIKFKVNISDLMSAVDDDLIQVMATEVFLRHYECSRLVHSSDDIVLKMIGKCWNELKNL